MNKTIITTTFSFLTIFFTLNAQDLRGVWTGDIVGGSGGKSASITITEKNGDSYVGTSYDDDVTGGFCEYKHEVTYDPATKIYRASNTDLIKRSPTHVACDYLMLYRVDEANLMEYLEGYIRTRSDDGTVGPPMQGRYFRKMKPKPIEPTAEELALYEQYKKNRKTIQKGNLKIKDGKIKLKFSDFGQQDGDKITIFYNNKLLAHQLEITSEPQEIEFNLDLAAKQHTLYFIANNLGTIPPNTSNMEIIADGKIFNFKLSTDLSSNNRVDVLYMGDEKP